MGRTRALAIGAASLVLAAGLMSGCGSSERTGGARMQGIRDRQHGTSTSIPKPSAVGTMTVSVNEAKPALLVRAFQSRGVADARRCAEIVRQGRPYPAGDGAMSDVRRRLVAAGIDAGTVQSVVAALKSP